MNFFKSEKRKRISKSADSHLIENFCQIALEHSNSDKLPFEILMALKKHINASDVFYVKENDGIFSLTLNVTDHQFNLWLNSNSYKQILEKTNEKKNIIDVNLLNDKEKTVFNKLHVDHLFTISLNSKTKNPSYLIICFEEYDNALFAEKEFKNDLFKNTIELALLSAEKSLKINHTKLFAKRAEEENVKKSKFIANMSHELRTPLTAILGYSQVLRDGAYGNLNEKQINAINAVIKSSQHLKQLMDEVLSMARVESGKEVAKPDEVIISNLIEQVRNLMHQQVITKGVVLEMPTLSEQVKNSKIFADPKHAKQILINILSNAIKYTPEGGTITLEATTTMKEASIIISDTGIGISSDKLETLFGRYERVDDPYSNIQEGTGIGLNISNKLAKLNNSTIEVKSIKNEGSCFTVTFPLVKKGFKSAAIEFTSENKSINLEGTKVLVIDDNVDTCTVLEHIIKGSGGEVLTVNSVHDAKKIFNENTLDMILTDLAMPGENGIDFINFARNSDSKNSKTPIMVLSACAFEKDKTNAIEAGANCFLPKPFKPQEILRMVRKLVK